MKSLVLLAVAGLTIAAGADNSLSKEEKSAGWKLLFDGKSLRGWSDSVGKPMAGDCWTIEDGTLKARSKPVFTEDLFSRGRYADFELVFDWKISPGGNSGVKYRIQDHLYLAGERAKGRKFELIVDDFSKNRVTARPSGKGQDYVIGFEYQVIDNHANADALSATTHSAAALYDIAAPSKDATKPVGDWNHSRLVVRGTHVEHWLNGEKVVDASVATDVVKPLLAKRWGQTPYVLKMLSEQPRKACPISLQNHDSDAWFKNIKIRRLGGEPVL